MESNDQEAEPEVTGYETEPLIEYSFHRENELRRKYEKGELDEQPDQKAYVVSQMQYEEYLASPEWQNTRDSILARDLGLCRDCGDQATEVHHIKYPLVRGDEDPDFLVSLCRKCHERRHLASRSDDWSEDD